MDTYAGTSWKDGEVLKKKPSLFWIKEDIDAGFQSFFAFGDVEEGVNWQSLFVDAFSYGTCCPLLL